MRTKVFAGIGQRVAVLNYGEGVVTSLDVWTDDYGRKHTVAGRRGIKLDNHTLPMNPAYFSLNELSEVGDNIKHDWEVGCELGYPPDHPLYWKPVCMHCGVQRLRGWKILPETLCRGRSRPLYR